MVKKKPTSEKLQSRLTWSEWLIQEKKTLSLQDDHCRDSNFLPHTHERQGFGGIPSALSPAVLPKPITKNKK